MRISELLKMLFTQSDEDRHLEWEAEQKRKRKHRVRKAMKQSFTDDIKELTQSLKRVEAIK